MSRSHIYVGLDVHKETIAVAIADHRRNGEVRFWGNIPNTPDEVQQLLKTLTSKHKTLEVSYEAGPCGYALYRQFTAHGVPCQVVAPSRLLRRPGERIKNDHRDAVTLARLARAGELTAVWVPEPAHEAVRDLVRARHAANRDLRQARLRIQSFLLKHDVRYPKKAWTYRHRVWLADRRFAHPAQQLTFQRGAKPCPEGASVLSAWFSPSEARAGAHGLAPRSPRAERGENTILMPRNKPWHAAPNWKRT